jgi:hypothetical protein
MVDLSGVIKPVSARTGPSSGRVRRCSDPGGTGARVSDVSDNQFRSALQTTVIVVPSRQARVEPHLIDRASLINENVDQAT